MMWSDFAVAAPELAAIGQQRIEATGLVVIGTLRRDGSPRISPVEPLFSDGELMLGMMWQSRKALDLLRDPRLTVHSTTCDRDGSEGDFKLYGRAIDVDDPDMRWRYGDVLEAKIDWRPSEPFHLFSMDIASAAFMRFGAERTAMRWSEGGKTQPLRHPDD